MSCVVALMFAFAIAKAADNPTDTVKDPATRSMAREVAMVSADDVASLAKPTFYPIPGDAVFDTYVVYPDGTTAFQSGASAVAVSERTIYSDTLGKVVALMPANQLVSDDISTTAPDGCALTRFTFQTLGKVDPNGLGGAYSVNYALYQFCPGSVSQANRTGLIIPGTSGTANFTDDGFHTVSAVLAPNTVVPTNFYLGISFSRNNAGVIMGAPPLIGMSCDTFDHPSLACNSNLGGFPDQPYASFNAEFFATDACPAAFVGYRNDNPKQSVFNLGANHPIFDDLQLNIDSCQMIAYEVMVKGSGFYSFDLTGSCGGAVITGTHGQAAITATPGIPNKLRFAFNPPIQLPQNLWISVTVNNGTSGAIMTGQEACTGHTADLFCDLDGAGNPQIISPADNLQEAFDVSITCAGSPPVGACCDMFVLDNNNDAVCRQVPQMNCPFPPRGNLLAQPKWVLGASCPASRGKCSGEPHDGLACNTDGECSPGTCTLDAGPFPEPCGVSSCCGFYQHEDPFNPPQLITVEDCHDQTQNHCNQQHVVTPDYPNGSPSLWQRGLYCGQQGQSCPRVACLQRGGDCTTPQPTFGCNDAFCCDCVCQSFGEIGTYCCEVEWDSTCVQLTTTPPCSNTPNTCDRITPSWDVCSSTRLGVGAHLITVPGTFNADISNANDEPSDPEFCCHNGFQPKCIGGPLADLNCNTVANCCDFQCGTCTTFHCVGGPNDQGACATDDDCCANVCGICPGRNPGPAAGVGSGWFKFQVPPNQTSVSISTCRSSSPANDSLIQVFDCSDHSDEQTCCNSLITIGCNDDAHGCGDAGTNSSLCVTGLTPLRTYYGMIAAKTDATKAQYIIDLNPNCSAQSQVANDFCTNPTIITPTPNAVLPSVTPFNLAGATPDCPAENCLPTMVNDIWYNYTAPCNGSVIIQTCGADPNSSPNTNMAVYPDCTSCPPNLPAPVGCSDFVGGNCGDASKVTINNVTQGQCYRVRLGDSNGNPVSGNLTISCGPPPCPNGGITANTPPNNAVDARRPHDPDNAANVLGISSVKVNGPSTATLNCFSVCESTHQGAALALNSVTPGLNVGFSRPIFAGALAKLTFTAGNTTTTSTTYISHPGNVNGDPTANSADVTSLVTFLGGGAAPTSFGLLSTDIDRSGVVTPLDILDEVDLLNGASQYQVWNGTTKATNNPSCP
ncbi:MAG: hypothetical protein HY287_04545 [Planctomycetes bacterium]|nr:hypothetical protein [Planctomycetota bacterium]